jgi:hypothetical protein
MTNFEIELNNGAHYRVAALLHPDAHTSAYLTAELERILRERYGLNGEALIKEFRYQT